MNDSLKSKYLKEFIREIQYKNRNPQSIEVLKRLDEINTNPEINLHIGTSLYRSRIITDVNKTNKKIGFYGYDDKDSFVPPPKLTRDMRANDRYIPYLYCAKDPYNAIIEVRPRIGAKVSIATIITNENIRLLDFTMQKRPGKMSEAKQNLFSDLSKLYAKPVTDEDDTLDYIPTQFIAEYAKNLGYDGTAFSSSLTPEVNSEVETSLERYNIVVFNYSKCSVLKSNVIEITHNYLDCNQIDDDSNKLHIQSFVAEKLANRLAGI